jgi:iron(III) transport system permease protein
MGTFAALAIFKTDALGRRFVALLFVGMLFVPLYLVTGAWDAGFGLQGWHTLATNPHLAHRPWLEGWRAAIWIHGLAAVPWVTLIIGAGLRAVEAELEEDAATCSTPLRVLWHITFRRASPAILMAFVWVVIVAATEISVTDYFQIRTFAEEVYTQSALGSIDAAVVGPRAIGAGVDGQSGGLELRAVGLWIGLVLSAVLALLAIAAGHRLFPQLAEATQRRAWIWRLGRARLSVTLGLWAILLLVAGLPLANFIYKAGVRVTVSESGRVRSWSAGKALERVASAPTEFQGELLLSARIGVAAATAALGLAVPVAWSMRASRGMPWGRLVALATCLTVPGPLLGLGLIHVLNRPLDSPLAFLGTLYDTNFAPWLVQAIRALPLATLILWPALASIPNDVLDAAATEGASWWRRLVRVALPQRWPALIAAWLTSFAIAVGELPATVLVIPPQPSTTISVRVFQLLHYGVDDRVAAICLVMVGAIAALTGIAAALLKRRKGRE